jgi:hypothetical protein
MLVMDVRVKRRLKSIGHLDFMYLVVAIKRWKTKHLPKGRFWVAQGSVYGGKMAKGLGKVENGIYGKSRTLNLGVKNPGCGMKTCK